MATAVAAVIARARRDIQHHFFSEDAVRPDRAIPFEARTRIEQRQFERMRARGVIHEAEPGHYWIDIVTYDVDLRRRFERIRTLLLVILFGLLMGLLVGVRG